MDPVRLDSQRVKLLERLSPTAWTALCGMLCLGYALVWSAVAHAVDLGALSDLNRSFWPAVREVLAGHPLHLYAAHTRRYGVDHGPVSLFPLSVVGALLDHFGLFADDQARRSAFAQLYAGASLLMARAVVDTAVAVGRGRPSSSRRARLAMGAGVLVLPPLWWAGLVGHLEVPMGVWFFLRAICAFRVAETGGPSRATIRAGAWLGLAMLTRSTVVLFAVPVGLVTLLCRGVRPAARAGAAAGVIGLVGMAPFLLADRADVLYSLFTLRSNQHVRWGSFMAITAGSRAESVAQAGDIFFVLLAILALSWVGWKRGKDWAVGTPNMFVLLTAAAACMPLLVKFGLPYYTVEMSAFALIWLYTEEPGLRRRYAAFALGSGQVVMLLTVALTYTGEGAFNVNLLLTCANVVLLYLTIRGCLRALVAPSSTAPARA